jgi:hypothetical protein
MPAWYTSPLPALPAVLEEKAMTQRKTTVAIGLALVFIVATEVYADGVSWTAGYPKADPCNKGAVLVSGTVTGCAGTTVTVSAWYCGSCVTTVTLNLNAGSFSGSVTGLTSGTLYNVTVDATISGCPYRSDLGTATPN